MLESLITIRYLFFKELQPPPSVQSEIFRMPFKVLWLSSHILLQKARKTAESHQVSLYAINFFFFLEQLVYNQVSKPVCDCRGAEFAVACW